MKFEKLRKGIIFFVACCVIILLNGCSLPKPMPPAVENFNFQPKAVVSPTKSKMSIAILKPISGGTFFSPDSSLSQKSVDSISRMLSAAQTDIEKILIAKGFTTGGAYPTIDEMTYHQKERSSLILKPTFTVDLSITNNGPLAPQSGMVSGRVVLEFLEPMSREKIWMKTLDLTPTTINNIRMDYVTAKTLEGTKLVSILSTNSVIELLNSFYGPTMEKLWNQLDAREIQNLQRDSDSLKSKTQYRGH